MPVIQSWRGGAKMSRLSVSSRASADVGDVAGNDEGFAAVDVVDVLLGAFFTDGEAEVSGEDEDDLLVGVGVPGDDAAFGELNAREHGLGAVDELAGEKRVELLGRDRGPGEMLEAVGHRGSVRQGEWLVVSR